MGEVVMVTLLEEDEFEKFWPQIAAELAKVGHLWADKWTIEYFYNAISAKHMQVWGAGYEAKMELLALTQVVTYPANRFFEICYLLGGRVDEFLPALEEKWHMFAAMHGCRFWESPHARLGWERKLRGRKTAIVLGGAVNGMVN